MTKDLKNSILKRIEQEKIQPRSKFYFFGKNAAFWSFFLLAIVFGSLSFSVMLYALVNTDFEIGEYLHASEGLSHILALMPFIWVLAIGIAIGLGIWGLKHTKKGYRIALATLVGSNILGSVLLGSIVYSAGGGEMIEEVLEENINFYEGARKKHQKFWGNPEKSGRLSGLVESIDETNKTIQLNDPRGRTWEVQYDEGQKFEVGKPVKMKGEFLLEGHFKAENIRPASRQEGMQKRLKNRFRENPELRAKIEGYLSPETKKALQEAKENNERIPRELHRQIREDIKENATAEDREELRPALAPPRGGPGENRNKDKNNRFFERETSQNPLDQNKKRMIKESQLLPKALDNTPQ